MRDYRTDRYAFATDGRGHEPTGTPGKRTLVEALDYPIQAKQVAEPSEAAQPPAPPTAGRPLPETARARMERAFGVSFSTVRVHEGPHVTAIGANAYAQGESIHFAPGKFDPDSHGGQELLGHELAHVVQQRAGRVDGPQGHGMPINRDPGLEAEADRAGAAAARGGQAVLSGAGAAPVAGQAPIQGNFGVELEVQNGWRVWESKSKLKPPLLKDRKPVAKGTRIVGRAGFELQAEDSGKESAIEFVSNPPGYNTNSEFQAGVRGMSTLATEIVNASAGSNQPADDTKDKAAPDPQKPDESKAEPAASRELEASRFGGDAKFKLTPGSSFNATMQITMGVPLASIPELFKQLTDLGGDYTTNKGAAVAAEAKAPDLEGILGAAPSGEVIGLYLLLRQYLQEAATAATETPFPKGVFKTMARTNFAKLFQMLGPQGDVIRQRMQAWIDLLVSGLPANPDTPNAAAADQRMFKSRFNYDNTGKTKPYRIATTRSEWLTDMAQQPNTARDRLSKDGREPSDVQRPGTYTPPSSPSDKIPRNAVAQNWQSLNKVRLMFTKKHIEALYEGMGSYGTKIDQVKYAADQPATEAAIIEIRNPPPPGGPDKWVDATTKYWNAMIAALNSPSTHTSGENSARTEAKNEVAMPPTPAQTAMRIKRGEEVIEDFDELAQLAQEIPEEDATEPPATEEIQ